MNKPKVSIIIPCYNQAEFLADALQSVLGQTYNDWECLIINDGSSDATEAVAREWLSKDRRIQYYYKENGGVSNSRNFGISKSDGDLILPLDADDKLSENYLEACVSELETSDYKIVYGKVKCFGQKDQEIDFGPPSLKNLLIKNRIHCSGLYRKEDWRKSSGYDENMQHGFEDWELWINILKSGGKAKLLDQCTLYYRIKPISRSTKINTDVNLRKSMVNYIFNKHINLYGYSSSYDIYKEKLKLEGKLKSLHTTMTYKQLWRILIKKLKSKFNSK